MKISGKVARRINDLIRLSGSPNENEAKNAALLACRLLRQFNIYVKESNKYVPDAPESYVRQKPEWRIIVQIKNCSSEAAAKALMSDHERAGYKVDEAMSVSECNRLNKQCVVMVRGTNVVRIELDASATKEPETSRRPSHTEVRDSSPDIDSGRDSQG